MSSNIHKSDEKGGKRKGGKRTKTARLTHPAVINDSYQQEDLKAQMKAAFTQQKPLQHETQAALYTDPFTCCVLPNFLQDDKFLEGLRDELMDQIFCEKNNDLYKFQQTDDLRKMSSPHVRAIRRVMGRQFLEWMRDVTGIPLTDRINIMCSRYDYTDILLCHDDELDTRRIAFILYLVPPWSASDGGTLDLYDMDEHGQAHSIVRSLVPQHNSVAWFEVTAASHHQVSEVVATDKMRLSVHGWFYAPPVPRPARYIERPLPLHSHIHVEEQMIYDWINPIYLTSEVQAQIQERFENDSEIELLGFLKEDKYEAVCRALKDRSIAWQRRGPPNKRNYERAGEDTLPPVLSQCLRLLQSEAMFLILSNLTGLSLHPLAPQPSPSPSSSDTETVLPPGDSGEGSSTGRSKPRTKRRKLSSDCDAGDGDCHMTADIESSESSAHCRLELRRWSHGCYTLLHDTDSEACQLALDAMFFCLCKGWQTEYGGHTTYIAKGEDEELLTVSPADNSLALVYRDKETLRFVKHINDTIKDMSPDATFYDFSGVYFE